jgi:hypothetical protein
MTRPTGFDQDLANEVLDRIADGEMMTKICESEHLPTARQFRHWLTVHEHLTSAYARARLTWADTWAERVMDISFNPQGAIDGNGNLVLDHAAIALLRLQTDNAKWLVGKWAPRTYGEKLAELPAAPDTEKRITKIERVIVGKPEPAEAPEPQRLIAYQQPEPGDLSPAQWGTLRQLLDTIDRTVGARDPDEVFAVIKAALLSHFGADADKSSA